MWRKHKLTLFILRLQPIVAGSQVYDSYGQKCNHRFLLNYGFAIEDNSEPDGFCPNEVPIALSMREDDPLYDLRYEFWMRRSDPTLSTIFLSMVAGSGNVNRPNTNIGDLLLLLLCSLHVAVRAHSSVLLQLNCLFNCVVTT
jgi:hypothetical protein